MLRFFVVTLILTIPSITFAQASVNPKGTGTISFSYQNVYVNQHLFGKGQNFNRKGVSALGEIRTHAIFFNVEYSITDTLAISGGLPYISSKYYGGSPDSGPHVYHDPGLLPEDPDDDILILNPDGSLYLPIDDGQYHGGLQDLALRLRYNAMADPLFVTPFIEYSAPSNSYPFFGHAVVGSRVAEFKIGTYVGGSPDFLPKTSIQARYAFGISQRILGVSRTRHHAELDISYSILEPLAVFGVVLGQVTNGGLDLPEDFPSNRSYDEKFSHHLQISRDNILDVGLGLQYSLNERMSAFGVLLHTVTARNMHATDYGLTFGLSWAFGSSPIRPCNC